MPAPTCSTGFLARVDVPDMCVTRNEDRVLVGFHNGFQLIGGIVSVAERYVVVVINRVISGAVVLKQRVLYDEDIMTVAGISD